MSASATLLNSQWHRGRRHVRLWSFSEICWQLRRNMWHQQPPPWRLTRFLVEILKWILLRATKLLKLAPESKLNKWVIKASYYRDLQQLPSVLWVPEWRAQMGSFWDPKSLICKLKMYFLGSHQSLLIHKFLFSSAGCESHLEYFWQCNCCKFTDVAAQFNCVNQRRSL